MKIISLILTLMTTGTYGQILSQVEHIYVDNNGVKIHYVSLGEGPLVVMIHGFPDFLVYLATSNAGARRSISDGGN